MAFQQHNSDVPLLNVRQLLPEGVYACSQSDTRKVILSAYFKIPKENIKDRIDKTTILNTCLKGDISCLWRTPFQCIDVESRIVQNIILLNASKKLNKNIQVFWIKDLRAYMSEMVVNKNERKWMMYFDKNTPPFIQKQILLRLIDKKSKYSLIDSNGKNTLIVT